MVIGIDSFKESFKDFEDCYTIIGGSACEILMNQEGLEFRATKDIDIIVLVENRLDDFTERFWEYIKEGQYFCGWKTSKGNKTHYYRFTNPKKPNYPAMIELFSKNPGYQLHDSNSDISPLHISDEISSLSAIMLNDEYYEFMLEGRTIVDGVTVLSAEYLIPFKMKAWLDLTKRRSLGEKVKAVDIKNIKEMFSDYMAWWLLLSK